MGEGGRISVGPGYLGWKGAVVLDWKQHYEVHTIIVERLDESILCLFVKSCMRLQRKGLKRR